MNERTELVIRRMVDVLLAAMDAHDANVRKRLAKGVREKTGARP